MWTRILFTSAVVTILAGCGGSSGAPESAQPASPEPAETSVICDFYAAGGPGDSVVEAAIAAISGESPAQPTRDAIDGMKELAARATGEEREDLLTFADVMNDAAMTGEDYVGWSDAHNAFHVKYAEQCGEEIAP